MSESKQKVEESQQGSGLTQRAALIMAANVISMGLTFILPLVLVRTLRQSDYGLYKQAFQILMSALGLLNLQVAVSTFYFTAREPDKKLQVMLNVMVFYGLVGALVFLFFLIWPGWVTLIFKSSELAPLVPLLGFAILWALVSTNIEVVPIAMGDVRIASVIIVVSQLSKSILMVAAALVVGSIESILVASIIHSMLQTFIIFRYIRRRFGRYLAGIDWTLFKAQIGNALPFGIGGIVAIVQNDMHNYFVSHHFEPATFAVYAVGCFQLPLLGMLSSSFASALNPELARHKEADDHQAIIRLWRVVILKLGLFFVPAFALLFVIRHEFITVLFTTNYEASVPIFAVNLFSILLGMAVHLHVLRLFDQLKYFRLKLYLALIPVTFGALYLGLRLGGLVGISVAVVCVQTLDVAITMAVVGRILGVSRNDLKRLAPIFRNIAAAVLAALAASMTRFAFAHAKPLVLLLCCVSVFCAVHVTFAFLFGAIGEEEKATLRSIRLKFYRFKSARLGMSSASEV